MWDVERCNKCAVVMGKIHVNIYCSAVAAMYQLLLPPCLFAPLCTRRRMCRLFNLHPSSGSAASPSAGAPSPEQSRNSTGRCWALLALAAARPVCKGSHRAALAACFSTKYFTQKCFEWTGGCLAVKAGAGRAARLMSRLGWVSF